ncbi:MAG: hypothetical protein NC299_09445 [Lachnospiraceae bacterium]|nr:hypothetical protein [Ruminococcus sp.]MCM1275578.1 hypothetical protein [Lachnospiraceae bacterium]
MSKYLDIEIKDVVIDNADNSHVYLKYYPENGCLKVSMVTNYLGYHKSSKEWLDMASYGLRELVIKDLETLAFIAEGIKDASAKWTIGWYQDKPNRDTPFTDEKIKQKIVDTLSNAKTELPKFIAEQLQSGEYADITDEDGWTDLYELADRLGDNYHIKLRYNLLYDMANYDPRFEFKDNEPRIVMLRKDHPMQLHAEKPLIRWNGGK